MRTLLPALLSVILSAPFAGGEMRVFTDDQGRQITAELIEAGQGWIKVKRKDGQRFTLTLDKLSAQDKTWLQARAKQIEEDALAARRAVDVPAKILAYCKEQSGKQVGNGECWTLADECFKACDLQRPNNEGRVWGRKVDYPKEKPQPGDIVEFRNAKFSDGSMTGPEHTAIVIGRGRRKGVLIIAEQNWSGGKTVHECELNPAGLQSGEMMFYRPE